MAKPDIEGIREAIRLGKYIVRRHARRRMEERQVRHDTALEVILEGKVIEEYPSAEPFPKCLVMKHIEGEPLYVSCGFNGETAYIITVHWYDPEKWIDPWTRRE